VADDASGAAAADEVLVALSFPDAFRASEFLTAAQRLVANGQLTLHDAVFLTKEDDGRTYVQETVDLDTGRSALGAGLWTSLFGLILGGPVGLLVGGAVGAGAGALTAKLVDLGVTDETVDRIREVVRPGTTTLVLLASHVDRDAALAELRRFEGAEYVWGNLSLDRLADVNRALSPDADEGASASDEHAPEAWPGA
jgi:uncharacterized membrane protein